MSQPADRPRWPARPLRSGPEERAEDAVQAPDDDDGKHLESDEDHAESAAHGDRPQRPADDRQDTHHDPGDGEVAVDVDTGRCRNLRIVRDGPQGHSGLAPRNAPRMLSRPPTMTMGNTLSPTRTTPNPLPTVIAHNVPPTTDKIPTMTQVMAK